MSARRRRGVTFLEVLIAALIVGTCIASVVSLFDFSFRLTLDSYDQDVAYTLARNALETIKETGFYYTAEAPTTSPVVHYYDRNQANQDSRPSAARYKVAITVVSDRIVAGSNPIKPAEDALRTVTVTVTLLPGSQVLYQGSTYLVRAGI